MRISNHFILLSVIYRWFPVRRYFVSGLKSVAPVLDSHLFLDGPGQTSPEFVVAKIGCVPKSVASFDMAGLAVPGTTSNDAAITVHALPGKTVVWSNFIALLVAVLHPHPDIAGHVEKAQLVHLLLSHRMSSVVTVLEVPRDLRPVVTSCIAMSSVPIPSPCGILPFGFARRSKPASAGI